MELEQIKRYIRVDTEDEDDDIKIMYEAAVTYLEGSVGKISKDDEGMIVLNPLMKIKVLKTVKTLYDNRDYIDEAGEVSFLTQAINLLMQLDQME